MVCFDAKSVKLFNNDINYEQDFDIRHQKRYWSVKWGPETSPIQNEVEDA